MSRQKKRSNHWQCILWEITFVSFVLCRSLSNMSRHNLLLCIRITRSTVKFIFNHTSPHLLGIYSVNPANDAWAQAVNPKKDLSRKTDGWGAEAAYMLRYGTDNSGVSQRAPCLPFLQKLRGSSCHKARHLVTNTQIHLHSAISWSWSIEQSKHSHF